MDEDRKAITVLELAVFRGLQEDGGITMGAVEKLGLPFMGGCAACGACIACYNASPSKIGYLMCSNSCIGDQGYATVQEANMALFPEEYQWSGVKHTDRGDESTKD
jgi:hypothetical protein